MNNIYKEKAELLEIEIKKLLPKFRDILNEHGNNYLIEYAYGYVDAIQEKAGIKELTTCGSCSFCCHSEINVSKPEFDYIKTQIKKYKIKPNKQRSKIQNNKRPENLTFVERACPYLTSTDGKGLCSIYEIRPLVCRTHNSTEDPELCKKDVGVPLTNQEIKIVECEAVLSTLILLSEANNQLLKQERPRFQLIPIHKIF